MGESCTDMIITTEGPTKASTDVIGITHPTATAMTPRIGGVMIITQITESIVITERMTGVITGITGTEVTLTIQTIANTEITEATGISAHTEIMEVIGNMMDTENMETIVIKGGRRCTPQAECPLEHRIGDTATLVKCLWREHPSRTPTPFPTTDDRGEITQLRILYITRKMTLTSVVGFRRSSFEGPVFLNIHVRTAVYCHARLENVVYYTTQSTKACAD